MSEINIPFEERKLIKEVDASLLYKFVDQCIDQERSSALRDLRLHACGPYVSGKLRLFEHALLEYAKAKSSKKREETAQDALDAGNALISSVEQMQGRVKEEEKGDERFFVDDHVFTPLSYSTHLSVSVSYRWLSQETSRWIHGVIEFSYIHSLTPSYLLPTNKRKLSGASQARARQDELREMWDLLRRDALHAVKEFFKKDGNPQEIPEVFQVRPDPHGGGLNNNSTRFWL